MSTCENFKVKQKFSFYFKLVLFSCHKVVENGLKREVLYPTTSLIGESAQLNGFTGENTLVCERAYMLLLVKC